MARRRKQKSILDLVLSENWVFSASLAAGLSVLIFIIVPTISNPFLASILLSLRPLGLMAIGVLALVALVKYLRSRTTEPKDNWTSASNNHLYSKNDNHTLGEVSQAAHIPQTIERPTEWSLKLIQEIEWKRFEELSTAYYREKGIKAEATSIGADGGIDIKLYQDDSGNPTAIVQCKAWNSKQVGVKEIREFLGVMTHEKITKGFYMTSGEFSIDAKGTATANKITLINGDLFLAMIKRLPEESQIRLLALATKGDYKTPTCSSCDVKMVRRNSKRGEFWGCVNYPRCKHMLHVAKI